MENEKTIIIPSSWTVFPWFLVCLVVMPILIWLGFGDFGWILPLGFYAYKNIEVFCHWYIFDEVAGTVTERKGVFSVHTVSVNYFRIKSVQIKKPFLMRLVGIAKVEVITSEPFKPFLVLYGIHGADEWGQYLQDIAAWWRRNKDVKEVDFHHF